MLIILGIVLFVVLPDPWNWVALDICLLLGFVEIYIWWRTVRRNRIAAGAETLIGARAVVLTPCHPFGQVSVAGERWEASCPAGAQPDDVVTVIGRDRLLLIVERDPKVVTLSRSA